MKRLDLTHIARTDLDAIRRYSLRTWGQSRTASYMEELRDTLKGLVHGTAVSRSRDDLRDGLHMAVSGRHCIFFEADDSRVVVVRILHDRMDYQRHLGVPADPDGDD